MDYYAILGVQRTASAAAIREGYRKRLQIWRMRAAAADTSVRDEATKRLALIEQAYQTLSEPPRRAAHDRQPAELTAGSALPTAANSPVLAAIPDDPIQRAEYYLEQGDYLAAAGVAKEATNIRGDSAEAWSALSRAHAGLNQFEEAIYEARRATELALQSHQYRADLGFTYELAGRGNEALREYQQASQMNPSEPMYQLDVARVMADNNQLAQALPIVERVYQQNPDNVIAANYYGRALILMSELAPKDKSADGYAVTSETEIQRMREYLTRATSIRHLDQETLATIHGTQAYLDKMEENTFNIPISAMNEVLRMNDGSVTSIFLMMLMGLLYALLPLVLIIGAFIGFANNQGSCGLVLLLVGGVLCYVWYRNLWVPRWKVNARTRDHRIRNAV